MNKILEAEQVDFVSKKEDAILKAIVELLKDDGQGHHHALFAKRLADFTVKIVNDSRLCPTASMDFDHGIIRINSGFLNFPPPKKGEKFPALFRQLSVLMRHELAHALMMHQVRMAKHIENKYGKKGQSRISLSRSLHELENIIADFEISNTRYTEDDKETVRHMWLNGRTIGGLVTEDHRKDWSTMSLEKMYGALSEEIDQIQQEILTSLQNQKELQIKDDGIKQNILDKYYYLNNIGEDSNFIADIFAQDPVEDFLNLKAAYHFVPFDGMDSAGRPILAIVGADDIWKEWTELIKTVHEGLINTVNSTYMITEQDIKKIMKDVAISAPNAVIAIKHPQTGKVIEEVYSPEEKFIILDVLKELININNAFEIWLNKVQAALQTYSKEDIQKIFDGIK